MKKKLIRIAALGLAFSMLCIGCGNSGKSEGTQEENKKSEAADSDEPLKVSIAAQATSGQVFQYLAEERNYLEEEGIEVEVQYISNGTDAFSALSAGKVDILSTYGTGDRKSVV